MDAFSVFKIVMGIVISIFILMMIYNFATSFLDIDSSKNEATELKLFEQGIRDVYVNGIPGNFTFGDSAYESISIY